MAETMGRRFAAKQSNSFNSNQLCHRISIERKTPTKDGFGQKTFAWLPHLKLSANVRFENGKEFNAAGRDTAQTVASIRIRVGFDITVLDRVLYKGVVYNITAILPGASNEYVDLAVVAGLNDG